MTIDIRNLSHVQITDTYNRKTGEHLKSVCTSSNGDIIWEEGRTPSKDVAFLPPYLRAPWLKFLEPDETTEI